MENENIAFDVTDTVPSDGGGSAAPSADPPAPAPVEVISVDELLDRLRASGTDEAETAGESETVEEIPDGSDGADETPVMGSSNLPMVVEDTGNEEVVRLLTEICGVLPDEHPLLTTEFEDYTVAEGLLLCLLLCVVGSWCVKMLKGGFSWLLS